MWYMLLLYVCDKNIRSQGVKALSPVSRQKHAKPAHPHTCTHGCIFTLCRVSRRTDVKEQRCINYPAKFTQ